MDIYNAHAAWLNPQNPATGDPASVQHAPHADWKDTSPSNSQINHAAQNPLHQHQAPPPLDLDFLGDLSTPAPSSASPTTMAANSFYPFLQIASNQHFAPYNTATWPASSSHVPLSSYSTLNGATSPPTAQVPPQPANSQPLVIDPALTTISPPPPATSPPSYLDNAHSAAAQLQHSHYPYSHLMPNYQQAQAAAYAHIFSLQNQRAAQAAQQQQGTLSPQALHSPPPPSTGALPPSQFYSAPPAAGVPPLAPASAPQAAAPSADQNGMSRDKLLSTLRLLLLPDAFTGAGAVKQLMHLLDDYGVMEIDVPIRMEILTKVRDNAGNNYFRAWRDNVDAMDLTREWLKAGVRGDGNASETVMPLLHIIDRLPLTLETLAESKLGKIVVKLVKEPPSQGVKDMASKLERTWRSLLDASAGAESKEAEDSKNKKRKLEPASKTAAAAPPAKKQLVNGAGTKPAAAPSPVATTKKPPEKKSPGAPTPAPAVKDAKSDSSFFSAPKPKPRLPTFRKGAPPAGAPAPAGNVAQPSAVDPFQEALAAMKSSQRRDSPAQATPPPASVTAAAAASAATVAPLGAAAKPGKKRKRVSWAPAGDLEKIKLITKAVYDDDPMNGTTGAHDIRDLERAEGAALHAHASFEEAMDWTDPPVLEIPASIEYPERGEQSVERGVQEQREQTAISALYMTAAQIPDSPAEPAVPLLADADIDREVVVMLVGAEAEEAFWHQGDAPAQPGGAGPPLSVSDLVGRLGAGAPPPAPEPAAPAPQALGLDPAMLAMMQNLPPEQLQQFFAQANQIFGTPQPPQDGAQQQQQQQPPPAFYGAGPDEWQTGSPGQRFPDLGQQQPTWGANGGPPTGPRVDDDGRGRGGGGGGGSGGRGRGRGRGRGGFRDKRIPCTFFAQGRCRYGDQCDYSHDLGQH